MSKKNKREEEPVSSSGKGFSTDAFANLKALHDRRKAVQEAADQEAQRREAERALREAERRREEAASLREFRFTEADLHDTSNLSDKEIFEASMSEFDGDVYQSKFSTRETPQQRRKDEPAPLTMTEEEREFAIFTQEMAVSNVSRLRSGQKPVKKTKFKNKQVPAPNAKDLETLQPVSITPVPAAAEPGMRTDYAGPTVAVTQAEKGGNILESPDPSDEMTSAQKHLLKDIKHYEARYGMVISLHLRGLTLNAAMSRLDEFIDACIRSRKPYALVICGKGLNSADQPVIKEHCIGRFRQDSRIIEYAPVINTDGNFGSIYISVKLT